MTTLHCVRAFENKQQIDDKTMIENEPWK
jgi:hypothetical protein